MRMFLVALALALFVPASAMAENPDQAKDRVVQVDERDGDRGMIVGPLQMDAQVETATMVGQSDAPAKLQGMGLQMIAFGQAMTADGGGGTASVQAGIVRTSMEEDAAAVITCIQEDDDPLEGLLITYAAPTAEVQERMGAEGLILWRDGEPVKIIVNKRATEEMTGLFLWRDRDEAVPVSITAIPDGGYAMKLQDGTQIPLIGTTITSVTPAEFPYLQLE